MAGFAYSAISIEGLETVGEIHAPDLEAAREQLRIRGLLAHDAPRARGGRRRTGSGTTFKKVKPRSMQVFSRQFATMIEAGLNIVAALVILEEQTDDEYLAAVISELRADVEGGLLLSQAMARHPKVFTELYVSMVQAGEASGMLDHVLDRVADQIEKETKLKRRVKGAMIYPTVVFTFASLVLMAMLMFIVPIFAKIFTAARRTAADADAGRPHASDVLRHQLVHRLPADRASDLGCAPLQEAPSRVARSGTAFKLRIPMRDRRGRAQGDHGAAAAHARDARRRRRRHHQGARDRRLDGGQLRSSRRRWPRCGSRCRKASRSRSR